MNPFPGGPELGQVALTVRDVAQAKRFYGDVLGLRFLFDAGPHLSFYAAGAVRLMLTRPDASGEVGRNSPLYFKVPSAAAAHAVLLARGATDEQASQLVAKLPDHELWMAFVRDPDGNLIGLMEERR